MKSFFAITLAALLSTGLAAPMENEHADVMDLTNISNEELMAMHKRETQGFFDSIFGGGGDSDGNHRGLIGNLFDGASCIVDGVFGGGDKDCSGKGESQASHTTVVNNNVKDTTYKFKYDTTNNGKLEVTITPNDSNLHECTSTFKASDGELKDLVKEAGDDCLNQ